MNDRRPLALLLLSLACSSTPQAVGPSLLIQFERGEDVQGLDHLDLTWIVGGSPPHTRPRVPEQGALPDRANLGTYQIQVDTAGDRTVIARGHAADDSIVAEGAVVVREAMDTGEPVRLILLPGRRPDGDDDHVPDDVDNCPGQSNPDQSPCPSQPDAGAGAGDDGGVDGGVPDARPPIDLSPPPVDLPPPPDSGPPPDVGPPPKLPVGAACLGDAQCASGHCPDARAGRVCASVGMVAVPASSFTRGCLSRDKMCSGDEQPPRTIMLTSFEIDQYEVTHADYQACRSAGACAMPAGLDPTNKAKFPVGNLTWAMADAYCRWAGKRLPTEAEWEHAARGPADFVYPWGDFAPDCMHAQYRGCGPSSPLKVGQLLGVSNYGAEDMAGNIAEWVSDWYSTNAYGSGPDTDPTGPASGTSHVLRGGAYDSLPQYLRTGARGFSDKALATSGVRCARDF